MGSVQESSLQLPKLPKRNPAEGTFELTVRCNLHCKMCLFRHDDCESADMMNKELTAAQWIDMARQVAAAGTGTLLITGGEPMIRPDFCEIWEGIYKQGFLITLYTNATLVNETIMKTLRQYPPHKIGVTLYGASPETYKKVCGNAEAFGQAVNGIHQLLTLPSIVDFRTTIIRDNYADANAIEELVHHEFGAEYTLTQTRVVTKAVRGGCADVEGCRLSPEDNICLAFRRGINVIKKYFGEDYKKEYLELRQISNPDADSVLVPRVTLFGCDAGMSQYTISWDGKLLGCQLLGLFETNALQDGFDAAWARYPFVVKQPKLNEKCIHCDNMKLCNCCIATRYAETGDPGGCPEYVCKDTAIIQNMLKKGRDHYEQKI